ncbi:hypothetical protein [Rhizobium sp. SL86]|uniref:hypothetical protein n=1 Tax=Rhizobium sp. SL86 TaxID=2995148 RepID=UPI0022763ACA|nr:hypothetical protein [Rhizobium sp. SL86]MCY1667847.1 hypothetical protein [Rhizobium sp. SL86]
MAAHVLGSGGWQIPYAEHASSQEVLTDSAEVSDGDGRLVEQPEEIGETSLQAENSVLIRAANDVTAAAMAYLNEVIGELPAVMTSAGAGRSTPGLWRNTLPAMIRRAWRRSMPISLRATVRAIPPISTPLRLKFGS